MSDHPTPLGGTCSARFDPLRELFAAKLESGEDLGASLAVDIDGEMVVDLWGGLADARLASRKSKENKAVGIRFQKKKIDERSDAVDQAGIFATRGSPSPQPAPQLIRAFPTCFNDEYCVRAIETATMILRASVRRHEWR